MNLKENTNDQANLYLYLKPATRIDFLLQKIYKDNDKSLEFPVDIKTVARFMGFSVKLTGKIGASAPNLFNKVLGQITVSNDEKLIEVNNAVSYKAQNYAIAHSLGCYLLLETDQAYVSSYAIPLMPSDLEEIAADKVALFLLLPLSLFKDEFKQYLERTKTHPLDVDDWLEYLSDKSQVQMFNLAIGYQQLK